MSSAYLDKPTRSELQACVERLEQADKESCGLPEDLEILGDRTVVLLNALSVKLSHMFAENGAERLGKALRVDLDDLVLWIRDEMPELVEDRKADLALMYRSERHAAE